MKKQGKYEKRTEQAAAKQPKVKSALLQTYLTSLLCMVLCVAMFLGTSYAWFTSEVNNEANEIYVGTLNVGFFKQDKDNANKWLDLAERNAEGKNSNNLFDSSIRWEPGYTSLETVKIINTGDLAFKYTLGFTDGTVEKTGTTLTLDDVAKYFDVWVYDYEANKDKTDVVPNPASYTALTAQNSGWVPAGTLDKILTGDAVLVGTMPEIPQTAAKAEEDIDVGAAAGDTYTIALHMNESATADVMGHKISLNAKLVAYQMGSETDDFGNAGYDSNIQLISTLEDLQKAVDEAVGGEVFVLDEDMTGDLKVTQKPDVKFTIDGNGHKFSGVITVDGGSKTYTTAGLTIQNFKFVGVTGENTVYINLGKSGETNTRYTDNVTVKDCSFTSANQTTAAIKSYTGGDQNLTIVGCTVDNTMHSLLQVANVEKGLKIVDCTVSSKNGINLNNTPSLEMSGCTFDVNGYAVCVGTTGDGNTDPKTYKITDCVLKSACAAEDDYVIIFRESAKNATLTLVDTTVDGTRKILDQAGNNISLP